jgi:hypothetical protein
MVASALTAVATITTTIITATSILAATAITTVVTAGPASAAPTRQCVQWVTVGNSGPPDYTPTVKCVRWSGGSDGGSGGNGNGNGGGGDGGGGGNANPDNCHWELYPIPPGVTPDRPPGTSPDAKMYWEICTNSSGNTYVGPNGTAWFGPGAAPLPSPQEVAQRFQVQIATKLHAPVVAADPAVDKPTTVDVPTFVAVANWQGRQTAGGCDATGTVCVELAATPALTFDPGESGADTIACRDGGTRYDPAGDTPRKQAAATGACAHTYTHRTGTHGRPARWPGQVTVTWHVHWQVPGGGEGGDFPVIALSADLPRAVQEVQGVVTKAGG